MGATDVEIDGLESRSTIEVTQLIGARFEYIHSKEATPWRAADAAFLVAKVLEDDGHSNVKISSKVLSKNRILLRVDEGQRFTLGSVKVNSTVEQERLEELYALPAKKGSPLGAGNPPFREEDVGTGLKFVKQELQSMGYWKAEVELARRVLNVETGEISIEIDVSQGPLFTIGQATVTSADWRGLKRTAITAELFKGKVATTENVNQLRAAAIEAFTSRGYPDAQVSMNRRLVGTTYFPDFQIDLGVRVRLLDVHVKGLERTNPKAVKRVLEPLEGEWYDEAAMNKKVKRLLSTGAFSSVRITTEEVARKRIDATLHLQEARAKEVRISAGAGSFVGPLIRAEYADRNFRGKLRGFTAGVELSGLGVLGEVRLSDPWWHGTDIQWHVRMFSMTRSFEGYRTLEAGLESGIRYDLTENYSFDALLGYSFVNVESDTLPEALLGDLQYSKIRLRLNQTLDYRDSKVLPKDGWHLSTPIELGIVSGDFTTTYVKLEIDGGFYYPIADKYSFGIGGSAQYVLPSGELSELPVDLRYFNGGARGVRSFPERELGPAIRESAYGGNFSWVVNTELTREITSLLSVVGFVDVGGVEGDYIAPREGGVEVAAGLGLRLELPIGPVRLEYGRSLTQGPGEPGGAFHFAIGSAF